jgi:hypothetical protein
MSACGVDTISLAWRPRDDHPFDALREVGYKPGPSGAMICRERGPGDERIVAYPANGLLTMEGRMGAILNGDAEDHSLVSAKRAPDAERACERTLRELLAYEPDQHTICEVRRYDLAREISFREGADGLAFLRTLAGIHPARTRTTLEVGVDGQVQTVYVRTPKRGEVQQRHYDKGVEAGTHPPGQRVRLESQLRPAKDKRVATTTLARLDLAPHFIRRMEPYVSNTENLVAAGSTAALDELLGRVAREELTMARAERLAGSLAILRVHGRTIYTEQQGQRRLRALREAGIALETELPADRTVPVGELLRQAMKDFSA